MTAPQKLGKYEILGPLARGGMAEVQLARVVGPAGFQRPVVIKRILPHLASDPSYEAMFLDEARIAASLRHRNVVQVLELSRDDEGGLFQVMEYLEGESVASIMRRLARAERKADWGLVSFIIAEACAGLDAAHELAGANGRIQNLVHRDVSPQNLFVTYAGETKILDFGIAKTSDRIGRTRTGDLKGKAAYMSPEQCLGEPLDRRSDIFSLGVVLFELSTGHRLFQRDNDLLVFDAVVRGRLPRPSEIEPLYPKELERVCMKALGRTPDERYPNAGVMRRELLEIAPALGKGAPSTEAVSAWMRDIFEDRVDAKSSLLASLDAPGMTAVPPMADADLEVRIPDVATQREDGSALAISRGPSSIQRRGAVWLGALLAGVALSAVWLGRGVVSSTPALEAAPARSASSAEIPSASPSPPSLAPEVAVHVATTPPGALVTASGSPRGTTPLDLTVPRATSPFELEVSKTGYLSARQSVLPDRERDFTISLVADPAATKGRSAASRRTNAPTRDASDTPEPPAASTSDPFHKFE